MFSSASSTRTTAAGSHGCVARFGRFDQAVARVLVVTLLALTPLTASAGQEFDDANNTTFNDSVVTLDNSQAGQTTFSIDTNRTIIGWEDLQQPGNNTLEFNFTDSNSIVLNYIGAQHPSNLNGSVISNGTVAFSNPFGIFIGDTAVVNVGDLIAIGANVSREDFMTSQSMLVSLTGTIENNGLILAEGNVALLGSNVVNNGEIIAEKGHVLAIAGQHLTLDDWDALTSDFLAAKDFFGLLKGGTVENRGSIAAPNAALFGGRVVNFGEIEIADGSLLMLGADAVWVTEFDNPVLIKLPNLDQNDEGTSGGTSQEVQYAIENHGRIDAGLGHVRLAASDPLGFAIRQGTGSAAAPASIRAQRIELEGGETGRVHLAGAIEASDLSDEGFGGEIDITGSMIVLEGATIQASGSLGGGTIHIGGEQEGRGDLQRARVVVVDEDSQIRADAIRRGDGGTVIVFAEDLTSVDGELSARGGRDGGDGGFVETSGLRRFHISRTPDLSARNGAAGSWLIDPFNITVQNTIPGSNPPLPPDCPGAGISCFNKAIDAILSPDFDDAGFDGILRTVDPADNVPWSNVVEADLIAVALATGTDVTLSTQAFGLTPGTDVGNIDILDAILVDSANTLEGTIAKLTFLAAGNINLDNNIEVLPSGGRTNLALTVELRANDASQVESDRSFDTDVLEGNVLINADIRTGGGAVIISGASVVQQAGRTIDTDGGSVDIRSGTVDQNGFPMIWSRQPDDPAVNDPTPAPIIEISGSIDTSDGSNRGGDVSMIASSLSVSTNEGGDDPLDVVTGRLTLMQTAQIRTGGGNVTLSGGSPPVRSDDNFAGSIEIAGDIDSAGGNVAILANHVDPDGDTGSFDVFFIDNGLGVGGNLDEGGSIVVNANITTEGGTLSIGGERTRSIQLDGTFNTTQTDTTENGIVQIVALDLASVDTDNTQYGFGEIIIGAADPAGTTMTTSALAIEARDITFSDGAGVNPVIITASGSSTATLPDLTTADDTSDPLANAEVRITGNRQITFNQNTEITGETIRIVAAPVPTELNFEDPPGINERPDSETRLVFGGTNGAGQLAADGVRLNGDFITISVGDGTTASSDLFSQDVGTSLTPTDFGLQRLTRATYDGLQLRDSSTAFRPEELRIAQDGDFTITNAPATSEGQLDLGSAFDTAQIGSNGMRITLESSDGVLTIEDAAALNNNPTVIPGSDDGKSFVVLNGGLFLPDPLTVPTFVDDTVVFGDGLQALGSGGTSAFDVESLSISTPGNFTVRQQVVDSITNSNELVFEAGRNTGAEFAAGRGTLTVDGGIVLQADDRLALLAGASGFGDLVFAGASTTLTANDLDLRGGGGINSENTDTSSRSRITGLQTNVTIRDASGAVFGDLASSATSFSYRQDAAIDAETDLPNLAQFGLDPLTGFRATGDVEYAVRSDQDNIDLDDGLVGTNEGDRFRNAALSLVGLDLSGVPAIDVSDEFTFVGKRIELGGIADFRFTQRLASAFNRSGTDAEEQITLRSGLSGSGNLTFDRGSQNSVIVKAPRIILVAGIGLDPDAEFLIESEIDVRNAEFDLAGPPGSDPTFVFQTSSFLVVSDLPDKTQFIGGNAGLPDILAIRTDLGILDFSEFEVDLLPIDLTDDPGRLILEAESISLSQTDGDDLELTSVANLNLRLRTNNLTLIAADSDLDAAAGAQVLIGARAGDVQPLVGVDSDLDSESLLIEAFDNTTTIATIENFSSVSAAPNIPGEFDLIQGHGPTNITIRQDGAVTPSTLFNRNAVSGLLGRIIVDDDDGMPIATTYTIQSFVNSATVEPENVNGSNLILRGAGATTPDAEGIIFEFGTGSTPGVFNFERLFASTESSILIKDGTEISANDTLSLAAGLLTLVAEDPGLIFGKLSFEAGAATTSLTANKILLAAGPSFELDGPDIDGDGERESIPDNLLPRIDFTNLDAIILTGPVEDSLIDIRQSASLDSTLGGPGDYLTPLIAGLGTGQWAALQIGLVQGNLILNDLDTLQIGVEGLIALTSNLDATLRVNVPDASVTSTPFADFDGPVELQSNDMTFASADPNTSLNLATDNLLIVSADPGTGFETEEELSRLRSNPDALDRPIVRIEQVPDFTATELPRPEQYFVIDLSGQLRVRPDLTGLDIELKMTTDGGTLTFDNDLRARLTNSNLILNSAGDVEIMLDGPTPGFAGLDHAALQLNSLEVTSGNDSLGGTIGDGMITIRPFMIGGNPEPLTIETTGDQRFDGTLDLETTLSTTGRDITFTGDVTQTTAPDAGLRVATSGKIIFEKNIGSSTNPLDHLWVTFDTDITTGTPNVEFGRRMDGDADGIFETPVASNQSVSVLEDMLFAAYDFSNGDLSTDIENLIGSIGTLPELEGFLEALGLGRVAAAGFATIGKALGDLGFNSSNGHFIMASGEKLSVGGTAAISVDVNNGLASLGDVSALVLDVDASEIGLVRRASGVVFDRAGESQQDPGSSISANTIDFGTVSPVEIGPGQGARFGVPNPFDTANLPAFLGAFPLFELNPNGQPFVAGDFRFLSTTGELAEQVPSLRPTGSSRSDLSGAFGPKVVPTPQRQIPETLELRDSDRLLELAVDAHRTPITVRLARLEGATVINDLGLPWDDEIASVTIARLDPDYADAAIALYEELFGREGERSAEIREILQQALDHYLANTRARRVVGFELRRFVKNRPSTLLEAYRTLESLDTLFRYHRRLGLSPGEYRRIQASWLLRIQPDGITLDELSEAIHPSRYVRGSDILDIFGR